MLTFEGRTIFLRNSVVTDDSVEQGKAGALSNTGSGRIWFKGFLTVEENEAEVSFKDSLHIIKRHWHLAVVGTVCCLHGAPYSPLSTRDVTQEQRFESEQYLRFWTKFSRQDLRLALHAGSRKERVSITTSSTAERQHLAEVHKTETPASQHPFRWPQKVLALLAQRRREFCCTSSCASLGVDGDDVVRDCFF